MFFFFKQKTAYDIGTGDWSSDVCSSDLAGLSGGTERGQQDADEQRDDRDDHQELDEREPASPAEAAGKGCVPCALFHHDERPCLFGLPKEQYRVVECNRIRRWHNRFRTMWSVVRAG